MKKIKKKIKNIIKKDNYMGCITYKILLIYRKIKYLKYKYKFEVDNGIILFDVSEGFNGKIKEIYEKILYDERYMGFQFVVAVREPKNTSFLFKDDSTTIIKRRSKTFYKFCAKAKYWIKDNKIDIHITPKKEQVVAIVSNNIIEVNNRINKIRKRKIDKYIKKYVDFKIYDMNIQNPNVSLQSLKDELYLKNKIKKEKIIINYKIYFKDYNEYFFNDYFNKQFLDALYQKFNQKYQFLIDSNFDIPDTLIKKYNNFFVNVKSQEESIINSISDILITNEEQIFDNSKLPKKRKLLFDNYKKVFSKVKQNYIKLYSGTDTMCLMDFLEKNQTISKKKYKKKNLLDNLKLEIINKNIITCKQDEKVTLTLQWGKKNICVPLLDKKTKIIGFLRNRLFPISKNYKMLKKYKNKYKGERCFLVGNGPSLTFDDLDMIKNEITFGCNLIYKIYNKTDWRPTFHCLADGLYAKKIGAELMNNICSDVFAVDSVCRWLDKNNDGFNIISIKSITAPKNGKYKVVSPMAYHYPGGTVMSMMLCLAIYMGFEEIYLIGVDCTSSLSNNGHFIKGYMNNNIKKLDMKRIAKRLHKNIVTEEEVAKYYYDRVMYVYERIGKYAKKKNIKIYNSTRGGALEVYERISLEEVLQKKEK